MMATNATDLGTLEYWREEVRRWAETTGKTRRKARQVNEPETAAKVLHLISLGTSKKRTARETGVCRLEIGRICWHHREAMDACRAAHAAEDGINP